MRSNITTEQANALYQDKHMFHIVVGDGNKMEIDNASVPVRWCLNDKMIDHLKKLQKQAYVCLTALHPEERRSGEYRWIPLSRVIVPITDSMTYMNINRAGKFTIVADIIIPKSEKKSRVRQDLRDVNRRSDKKSTFGQVRDDSYDYITTTVPSLDGERDLLETCWGFTSEFVSVLKAMERNRVDRSLVISIDCECDPKLFAEPLPEWFDTWVNFFYSTPPIDQCSRRRRGMVWLATFWVVPLIALVFVSAKALWASLWYVFIGGISPNWSGVFTLDPNDSSVKPRYDEVSIYSKYPILLGIHPLLSLLYMATVYLYITNTDIRHTILMVVAGVVSLAILSAIAAIAYTGRSKLSRMFRAMLMPITWPFNAMCDGINTLLNKLDLWLLERDRKLMDNLTCGGDPFTIIADPKSIPKPNKTFKLMMKDLKSKVCKPTAL